MLMLGFVIAQIIIFSVIIIVLKRLIFQDTTSAINRINRLDSITREKEKMLSQKLDETEKYFEQRKKEMEDEEKRLKLEAQRAANQLQEDIVKAAKTEAEDIIKKAQASRDKIKADAIIEAEARMIDICRDILGRVLSSVVQTQMNEQLTQEFLADLEQADLGKVGKEVNQVDIIAGRTLTEETKKIIKKILDNKLGRPVTVEVKEDRALLGGLVMKFGTMVVDGSLAEHVKEASDQMKDELSWKHA